MIYTSHALSYFDRFEVSTVFAEWRRVLEPGGILRISTPDFDQLLKVYAATNDLRRVLGPLFGRWRPDHADNGLREGQDASAPDDTIIHMKTTYNFDLLRRMLNDAGFSDVRRYDWRTTGHADVDDYSQAYFPHLDKENGIPISLNVEAVKSQF